MFYFGSLGDFAAGAGREVAAGFSLGAVRFGEGGFAEEGVGFNGQVDQFGAIVWDVATVGG